MKIWALLGRLIYRVGGLIALPIFLSGTTRTRVALIDKEKGVILLNKTWIGRQQWSLVGGGLDKDEDLYVGAVREVAEETGLRIDQSQLKHLGEIDVKEYMVHYKAHIFIAFVEQYNPKAPRVEILESDWYSLKKLPKDINTQAINMIKSELKQQG